jgi:hypothetical protein
MSWHIKSLKQLPPGVNIQGVEKRGRYPRVPKERRIYNGIQFDSLAEMRRYIDLDRLQMAGEISGLEPHPQYEARIAGELFCRCTLDNRYVKNGETIIEEIKSTGTRREKDYRLRIKAIELYNGIRVRIIMAK